MTSPDERATFALLGAQAAPLADGHDTGATWEAMELRLGAGARSPLHTVGADKVFWVVDGTVSITLGDEERAMLTGGVVHIPAGTPHRYLNHGPDGAVLLVITSGSGHVEFLRGMSALSAGSRPDPAAVQAHAAAHGVTLLPAG